MFSNFHFLFTFFWASFLQAVSQTIRANQLLNRKREKVNRKYTQTAERGRQLSPGFLEEALDEVCSFHLVSLLYFSFFPLSVLVLLEKYWVFLLFVMFISYPAPQ